MYTKKDVVYRHGLRVLDEHVEITIVVKNSAVDELEFRLVETAPTVLLDDLGVIAQ